MHIQSKIKIIWSTVIFICGSNCCEIRFAWASVILMWGGEGGWVPISQFIHIRRSRHSASSQYSRQTCRAAPATLVRVELSTKQYEVQSGGGAAASRARRPRPHNLHHLLARGLAKLDYDHRRKLEPGPGRRGGAEIAASRRGRRGRTALILSCCRHTEYSAEYNVHSCDCRDGRRWWPASQSEQSALS